MPGNEQFPRDLTTQEKQLLLWLLPADRAGYAEYRTYVETYKVVAQGRRGKGDFILAPPAEEADLDSPLPQVLAYGVVESHEGDISVTIREKLGHQLEFEIMNLTGAIVPDHYHEIRKWSFSRWQPNRPCPICGGSLREVTVKTTSDRMLVLALCGKDERIWVYDDRTGINHPIPVTNFYNELVLRRRIRDPRVALDSRRLFVSLDEFTDSDLAHAFRAYNQIRTKVPLTEDLLIQEDQGPTIFRRMLSKFRK